MEAFYTALYKLAAYSVVIVIVAGVIKAGSVYVKGRHICKRAALAVGKKDVGGILFGRDKWGRLVYSPAKNEGHCAVFGSSGCGKTSALLIPTLQAWTTSGGRQEINTCMAIDISGDISNNVVCANKIVYEPGSCESSPYDVLAMVDAFGTEDEKNEALAQLALLLLPDEENASASARFYREGARNLLTASFIYLYHKNLDFSEICQYIVSHSYSTMLDVIIEGDNYTAALYVMRCVGMNPEVLASFKGTCDSAVKLFALNANVRESIRRPRKGEIAFTCILRPSAVAGAEASGRSALANGRYAAERSLDGRRGFC